MYCEKIGDQFFGHGNPNEEEFLGRDKTYPNPMYLYRNDLYLFIISEDYSSIEMIIIPYGANQYMTYYNFLISGKLDSILKEIREKSTPLFNYNGLGL